MPMPAFEYLVLKLNTLQSEVEFEFLPIDSQLPFIKALAPNAVLPMTDFKEMAPEFVNALDQNVTHLCHEYGLRAETPSHYVFLSLASLDSHWYELWETRYSAVFLGEWLDTMAPPSLLEFMLTMVMIEGISSLIGTDINRISHLATRGCIADFNSTIRDVRYKTLQGFICRDCMRTLVRKIGTKRANNWIFILTKSWIGEISQPSSPASVVAKLGYNLFITKGLNPSWKERFFQSLREEGITELIKIVGALLLAAFLLWFGIKK
jgi:hypothetical protein